MFSCFRGSAESAQAAAAPAAAGPSNAARAPVLLSTNTLRSIVEYTRAFSRRAALSRAKIKAGSAGGTGTLAFAQLEQRVDEAVHEVDNLKEKLRVMIVCDLRGNDASLADDLIQFLEEVIWQNACLLLGRAHNMMRDAVNAINKVQELACRISPRFKGSYQLTWRVQQMATIMTVQECKNVNVAAGEIDDQAWQKFWDHNRVAEYLSDAQKLTV